MYIESLLFEPQTEKDKLIALCKNHNYNELKTQIAIKFFVDKEKPKDVWVWLCDEQNYDIEWDSVKTMKYRMKKQLFGEKWLKNLIKMSEVHDLSIAFRVLFVILKSENHTKENCYVSKSTLSTL